MLLIIIVESPYNSTQKKYLTESPQKFCAEIVCVCAYKYVLFNAHKTYVN